VSTARPFSFRSRAEFVGEKWSKNAELIVFHYADRLALTDCEEEIFHKSKTLDRAFRSNALFVLLLVLVLSIAVLVLVLEAISYRNPARWSLSYREPLRSLYACG
jgi:hypothetical protein